MTRIQQRSQVRREGILKGAAAVFAAQGYHRASMRDIARAAGGSLAGLYHHFATKEDILYAISARDTSAPPGWMDRIQLVTVAGALVLDVIVMTSMIVPVGELGFTPNRAAALGLNLVLLVSLAGSAGLLTRFLTGRGTFHRLERWQTDYLPVFAIWAAVVVVVFPPLFSFQ